MVSSKYMYEDKLETSRLVTRFLTTEDINPWTVFCSDPVATEFFADFGIPGGEPLARWWIERQLGRYRENRYGHQALILKESGEFIGQCGLLLQEVDGVPELEVGYSVMPAFWGRGYAPEAARMFMQYAARYQLADSVISIIDKRNVKSRRVAEKNGLKIDKETAWSGLEVLIYRIDIRDIEILS